jgi:hypothetical protein
MLLGFEKFYLVGDRKFPLHHRAQTVFGVYLTAYAMGNVVSFDGIKISQHFRVFVYACAYI